MIAHGKEIKVFCGNSNPALAEEICSQLYTRLGEATVSQFADGECSISVGEAVRGKDVFIVQSTCNPVNDHLMELLVMTDAMRRAISATPARTARPRAAIPSPPSWWRTSLPPPAPTAS